MNPFFQYALKLIMIVQFYILDLKEKNSNLLELDIGLLFNSISHYNEDVFVKIIKLHNFFDKKENIEKRHINQKKNSQKVKVENKISPII